MKVKYKVSLALIGLLLTAALSISIGYGVYISTNNHSDNSSVTMNCFKAYFSNGQVIEMKNIDSVINEEGLESSPYTLTITNICNTKTELQVRLNILKGNTIDVSALTINTNGDIERETILYSNLETLKPKNENIEQSKLLGKLEVEPNETIRTNVKIWFDEKKAPTIDPEAILLANFELVDTASSVNYSFAETLLANAKKNDSKEPNFKSTSTSKEGLYKTTVNNEDIYYYRGVVNNNYVKFAHQTWRVVSINSSNKTIKLVLEKSAGNTNYANYSSTFDDAGLQFEYYYKMTDNNITTYLNNWYNEKIVSSDFDKYVVTSSYCNDSTSRKEIINTFFGAYDRTINNFNPTLTCPETTAKFGGGYIRKVGLLTADEVLMAGASYDKNNHNYYLYNGENYFTMSPSHHADNKMNVFMVNNNGGLVTTNTDTSYGVRPVITIDGSNLVSGNGTVNNPYEIYTNEE